MSGAQNTNDVMDILAAPVDAETLSRLHRLLESQGGTRWRPRCRVHRRRLARRTAAARRDDPRVSCGWLTRPRITTASSRPSRRSSAPAYCGRRSASIAPPANSRSTSPGAVRRSTFRWTCRCRTDSASSCSGICPRSATGRPAATGRSPSWSAIRGPCAQSDRLCDQPAAGRRSVPPRAACRRLARRLHRRRRRQDDPPATGGGVTERRTSDPWRARVEAADWTAITDEVNEYGGALLPQLLTPTETERIRASCTTRTTCFAAPSTWVATASGRASTATSGRPTPNRSSGSNRRCIRRLLPIARDWWCEAGPAGALARHPRRMAADVSRRGSDQVDRDPLALRPTGIGTRCIATSTATSSSRCRS